MVMILYFIGAGISKALALPSRPIPAMHDFIATIANYVYDDVILTTLAELEHSAPYPYAWESERAKSIAQKFKEGERSPSLRAQFARALKERPVESIEDLLERSNGQGGNLSAQSSEIRFKFGIRRLFALIEWDLNWAPLLHFLQRQLQIPNATHVFVSFNYDLILDRALQRCLGNRLDLSRCYGFEIDSQVTGEPPLNTDGSSAGCPMLPLTRTSDAIAVSILKPHGSLNWLVSSGWNAWKPDLVTLPLTDSGELRYLESTELFQRFKPPGEMPVDLEPCILTPRTAKQLNRAFLNSVRELEEEAIRNADQVYVLGWSIPKTDRDQEDLIKSNIAKRTRSIELLTAVNQIAGADYYQRVRDIFQCKRERIQVSDSGFIDFSSRL